MSETENKETISEKPEPMETESKPVVEKAEQPEGESGGGGDAPAEEASPETNGHEEEEEEEEEEEPEEKTKEEPVKEEEEKEEEKEEEPEEAESEENGEEEGSDGEAADSSDELKPGLLEQPLVQSGKRAKKKVERLSMSSGSAEPKKKVEIKEGTGTKLGEIPRVEMAINKNLAENLKVIHRICFSRVGQNMRVKSNIKQFSGFPFSKGSTEYDRKHATVKKMTLTQLKGVLAILDIERNGTKDDLVEKLMSFLMKPEASGKPMPAPKAKRKRSSTGGKKSGTPGKRGRKPGSKNKTPSKKKKKEEKAEEGSDSDDEEEEEDEDESDQEKEEKEEKEENSKSDAEEEESESEEEEVEVEPPKKKRAKKEAKETPVKKAKKEETPKKQKKTPVKEVKKEKKRKSTDNKSDSKKKAKKANKPPSDDELKDVIKKILDGANLEEVTMKTLCKQVYAKYPDFDLTERKDFIKATVKQIIR